MAPTTSFGSIQRAKVRWGRHTGHINKMMDIFSPFVPNPLGSSEGFFVREILNTGLFHGFFFSLPLSIPMLICFRRYLLDGFSLGNYAFAGTLLGHLSFVYCTVEGIRPIIYFWYPLEPLLSLLGFALSLKVATDFFSQRRFVFDGTLGALEDSSAYAMNPWPTLPNLSWENLTGSPLPRPLERFFEILFGLWENFIQLSAFGGWPKPIRTSFQRLQSFFQRHLGPSIFTFQFFLMWLNPASASTLNLLFFEHELLAGLSNSQESPIFLFYTLAFIAGAVIFCSLSLFVISQIAGRSFSFFIPGLSQANSVRGAESVQNWLKGLTGFNEALAQKRFKILNKFFTFLILGCLIQSSLNYSWRLFLQYPVELIHWDFFNSEKFVKTMKRNFGILNQESQPTPLAGQVELLTPHFMRAPNPLNRTFAPVEIDEIRTTSNSLLTNPESTDAYWETLNKKQNFENSLSPFSGGSQLGAFSPEARPQGGETSFAETQSRGVLESFGRREFPPYDTSIRNREKTLPVERHLAIERVNSRRALMGRPPLENEERENAIFKYHTFFINQIDRTVEDFKLKLRTPKELYREEDDVIALMKLHENYLKQKGRESPYQNSSLPKKGNSPRVARHDRDFFTKARPVKNTTKGLLKSSYIRDLFDENLSQAPFAYSHDDLLLEKILKLRPRNNREFTSNTLNKGYYITVTVNS